MKLKNPIETEGSGLALNSGEYVVYLPEGGEGQVVLPAKSHRIYRFDPRRGETIYH